MRLEGLGQTHDGAPPEPCFQLVPRRLRASAAHLSPDAYALLTGTLSVKVLGQVSMQKTGSRGTLTLSC